MTLSRRTLLKGLAAGAGLAVAGPTLDVLPGAMAAGDLLTPGSRPFPQRAPGVDSLPKIEHIVVLMMENHSFDCYFGMLGRGDGFTLDRRGRPTASNPDAHGVPVRTYHAPSTCQAHYRVSQSWDASHRSWNGGRNDGFVVACSREAMAYWTGADLPFYYSLARSFPICDRYFASCMAQTYPNRRFLMAATALGQVSDPFPGVNDPRPPHGTIFDLLNEHQISWKNYFVDLPTPGLFPYVLLSNPGKIVPVADFFVDAAAGTLPAFSLVDNEGWQGSEENPQDIHTGEYYASLIINAVLQSPAWSRTLLVLTYDEHGGYHDHVPPPRAVRPDGMRPNVKPGDTYGDLYSYYGFRVPTVVISPWARRNYVSHVTHDHTSILRLVETKWNLPALTYRDANASNLLDCLDLTASEPPFANPPALAPAPLPLGQPACYLQNPTSPV
ncbi:MAG TPA: alkaline phosphatase family protein [Acidimicrobiales bacterium]|nr:alkaline phosphatase family protein [Acidimicrobiales bacterium]